MVKIGYANLFDPQKVDTQTTYFYLLREIGVELRITLVFIYQTGASEAFSKCVRKTEIIPITESRLGIEAPSPLFKYFVNVVCQRFLPKSV